jgi:hypothetical protein
MTNYAELYEKETGKPADITTIAGKCFTDEFVLWLSSRCEKAEKLLHNAYRDLYSNGEGESDQTLAAIGEYLNTIKKTKE